MKINLKERNMAVVKRVMESAKSVREKDGRFYSGRDFREEFKKHWGVDPYDPAMLKENFSWGKAAEKMAKFREAEMSTAYIALMRAGVQNIANNAYQALETTHESWTTVVPSSKTEEPYAPLQSVGFPGEVAEGGLFPEVSTAGLNLKIRNRKYGSLFAISMEAEEDDQTGQLRQKGNQIGEYLKILTEVLVMSKLISPSGGVTYLNLKVPVSETKPSGEAAYPWAPASAPFIGGGYNRPASYAALSDATIKAGLQALGQQKDLMGNFMAVKATHVLASPKYQFDIAVILNSAYYPAGAQSAGVTGGNMSVNVLKGILDPLITPYMPKSTGVIDGLATSWAMVDASKPAFVVQVREGVSVIAEAPNSGQGFERQINRHRCSMRQNADFIDPRFMWLGNDGSV